MSDESRTDAELVEELIRANQKLQQEIIEYKQIEQSLRESNMRYRSLFDAVPVGLYRSAPDGRLLEANHALVQMLGYPDLKTFLASRATDHYLHPEDREKWKALIEQSGTFQNWQLQFRRYDGAVIWVRNGATAIRDVAGQVIYYQGIIEDITEQKRTEEDRARFTDQLHTAAEVSTQLAAILDIEQLLYNVVTSLQKRFDLYHVHVYLLNATGDDLIMRVGSGEVGRLLRKQGHHIPLDHPHSLVAAAARARQIIAVSDVHSSSAFLANPLLPETHAEAAIPLIVANRVVGVLDVQDNIPARFRQPEFDIFSTLAGQIAVALQNARLFDEQKRTERELRETKDQLEAILLGIADGIMVIDAGGQLVYVNEAAAAAYGYIAPQAILGVSHLELFEQFEILDEAGHQVPLDQLPGQLALQGQKQISATTLRCRAKRKNEGAERWSVIKATPIFDESKQVKFAVTITHDITERKKAERALRQSEARYRALFEQANDAIFLATEEDKIVDANRRACKLLGYTRAELLKMEISDLQAPEVRSPVANVIQRELEYFGERSFETVDIHRDGRRIPVEVTTSRISGDVGDNLVLSVVRDIAHRKKAEDALQRYATRLEALHRIDRDILAARLPKTIAQVALDHIRHMIPCIRATVVEFDLENRKAMILAVHADGETRIEPEWTLSVHNFNLDALMQGRIHVVNDMASLPQPSPLEQAIQTEGVCAYMNVPLIVQDQLIGSLNVGAGSTGSFTANHMDIAEEVGVSLAIAIQYARLFEQAQQDAETKARLLHEVNHRVKNNLAAIVGLLYIEQNHRRVQPACQTILADLINRVEGLATVHRLLSDSQWSPLLLSELAHQILHSVLHAIPSGRRVSTYVSPAESVYVMPKQANNLAMVINELVTNTVKYAVPVRRTVAIEVRIAMEEGNIVLEYRDDGPGFPLEILQRERGNVGLYLIHNIVRSDLHGEVSLRNDNGAVVTLRFEEMNTG